MQVVQFPSTLPNPVATDLSSHSKITAPLLHDFQGEILIVFEHDGNSDVLCRNQDSGLAMLRRSALWCAKICKLKSARFYSGVVTSHGGRFHTISREQAIERVGKWVFGKT